MMRLSSLVSMTKATTRTATTTISRTNFLTSHKNHATNATRCHTYFNQHATATATATLKFSTLPIQNDALDMKDTFLRRHCTCVKEKQTSKFN